MRLVMSFISWDRDDSVGVQMGDEFTGFETEPEWPQ